MPNIGGIPHGGTVACEIGIQALALTQRRLAQVDLGLTSQRTDRPDLHGHFEPLVATAVNAQDKAWTPFSHPTHPKAGSRPPNDLTFPQRDPAIRSHTPLTLKWPRTRTQSDDFEEEHNEVSAPLTLKMASGRAQQIVVENHPKKGAIRPRSTGDPASRTTQPASRAASRSRNQTGSEPSFGSHFNRPVQFALVREH